MLDLPSQTKREAESPPSVHLESSIIFLKDFLAYLFLIIHIKSRDFPDLQRASARAVKLSTPEPSLQFLDP